MRAECAVDKGSELSVSYGKKFSVTSQGLGVWEQHGTSSDDGDTIHQHFKNRDARFYALQCDNFHHKLGSTGNVHQDSGAGTNMIHGNFHQNSGTGTNMIHFL